MKNLLFLMIGGLCLLSFGCNYTGVPVEFANTCDKANDDKYVEVVGYFNNTGSSMCSKSGNSPMRCPIDFVGSPNSEKDAVRAYIDKGSGVSSVDNPDDGGLKIKDDKGEYVENSQKVKIVAAVTRLDAVGTDGCFIEVKKIEPVK